MMPFTNFKQPQGESSAVSTDSKNSSSGDSFKNSSSGTDTKKTKNKASGTSRIVSSRYRQAAITASQKNASNSSKESSKTASSLDRTLARIAQSPTSRAANLTSSKFSNKELFKPRSRKNFGSNNVGTIGKADIRLHSTAVNSSAFFDKTNISSPEYFSTTIVAQKGVSHGGQCSIDSLAALNDISEICPSSVQEDRKTDTAFDFNVDLEKTHESKINTKEDCETAYLEYLTWAYINSKSEEAFEKQINEAQNQITFLTLLNETIEQEISEEKRKIELLDCYENISLKHQKLKEELSKFNECTEPCKNTLDDLNHHLELQMNQIKLENIHIPTEETKYNENLNEALQEGILNLQRFSKESPNYRKLLHSVSDLSQNIVEESNQLDSCLKQREKLANIAIQEASLKICRSTEESLGNH